MVQRDNVHIDLSPIRGHQRQFNAVISPREDGKSAQGFYYLWYKDWKATGQGVLIRLVRQAVEITGAMIEKDFKINLNKFLPEDQWVKPTFKQTDAETGICPVYDSTTKKQIALYVALSIKVKRLKDIGVENPAVIIMDEFIINPQFDEAYLKGEAIKFKEFYNTIRRENPKIQAWFFGNPYSLYNPYLVDWGVDVWKLKKNEIYAPKGLPFAVWYKELNPLLKEKLLDENPLYKFDKDYIAYALEGNAVNDANIHLNKNLPNDFYLDFVLAREDGKKFGVYKSKFISDYSYYVKKIGEMGSRRFAYTFSVDAICDKHLLVDNEVRWVFRRFKQAMSINDVEWEDLECYYFVKEIYKLL